MWLLSVITPVILILLFFFFSSRRRHTRCYRDWSSDVCSSDLAPAAQKVWKNLIDAFADVPAEKDWVDRAKQSLGDLEKAAQNKDRWINVKKARSEERRVGKEWRRRRSAMTGIRKIQRDKRERT